jgi:hypothetical protein
VYVCVRMLHSEELCRDCRYAVQEIFQRKFMSVYC